MKSNARKFTTEEIYAAYLAAPPEIRREVRSLLAEDCRKKGNHKGAEQLLSMED